MTGSKAIPSTDPLWQGSVAFLCLALGLGLIGFLIGLRGKLFTRHETGLWCFVTSGITFLMWLMWICMWLMQWNPIIAPYQKLKA